MFVSGVSKVILALGVVVALGACASAPAREEAASWRKLTQVEQRFAIFMDNPATAPVDGLATFRFVFVYAPGAVEHEGREVSWQEYPAMTVNCAEETVKVGPRTRYAPDGSVIMSDDTQYYANIVGPAVLRAAAVSCQGITEPQQVLIPDGPDWREVARAGIASSDPF